MTYGQSDSANNSQFGYAVTGKVYQYFNKSLYKYEDPALGGTGKNGSVFATAGGFGILRLFDCRRRTGI